MSHWICASNVLTPLNRQVASVLQTPQADFELRYVDVQRQVGGSDCGLFALTFATALCSGVDPFSCSFKQTQMRSHLLTCFENQQMSTFPPPEGLHTVEYSLQREYLFIVYVGYHGINMIQKGVLWSNAIYASHGFISYV